MRALIVLALVALGAETVPPPAFPYPDDVAADSRVAATYCGGDYPLSHCVDEQGSERSALATLWRNSSVTDADRGTIRMTMEKNRSADGIRWDKARREAAAAIADKRSLDAAKAIVAGRKAAGEPLIKDFRNRASVSIECKTKRRKDYFKVDCDSSW